MMIEPIQDDGTKEVRGFHQALPNEITAEEAERRRQEKARQTKINTGQNPPVPGPVEIELAERMAKIIPLAARNQAQAEAQQKQMLLQKNAERIDDLRKSWGAPLRHVNQRAKGYSTAANGLKWQKVFDKQIFPKLGKGFLVALIGPRDPGKTQLAVEAMFNATEMLMTARYTTAMDVFLAVKKAYKKDSPFTEESIMASFSRVQLLVIDETQERGETEWEDRILTHILDTRYRNELDTILCSNQTQGEFETSMGKSVVKRLNQTGGLIVCDWPGFREGV